MDNARASWSAAGSEAPRRFGFNGPVAHELGVSTAVGRRSKAPSSLRSAGALQNLADLLRFMDSPHADSAAHWDHEPAWEIQGAAAAVHSSPRLFFVPEGGSWHCPGGARTVPVRSAWPGTKAQTFCSPPQRADMLRTGDRLRSGGSIEMRPLLDPFWVRPCRAESIRD